MKLIIAGSRSFDDYDLMDTSLAKILSGRLPDVVLSGRAEGADVLGERWAEVHGVPVQYHPADWKRYGKVAGMKRNAEMAKDGTHLVAFWDGVSRGTANMIDIAKLAGLQVRVVYFG